MEDKIKINEKETIRQMKKQLSSLKNYCANMRLQSILYGEEGYDLQVEDDIGEYLHFSKSVVKLTKQKQRDKKDPVLQAMFLQQRHHEAMAQRDAQAFVLLQGIAQLSQSEKELLLDVYVRQYRKEKIMAKEGGIVESTYQRRLHRAILNLAIVLRREIYKNKQEC